LLQNELPQLLRGLNPDTVQRMWLQQDGAAAHSARSVTNVLNEMYPRRWIGRTGYVSWPPRSPDLTSPDFFLWGYLKGIVHETMPQTDELKGRITRACENIPAEVIKKTEISFRQRLQFCIDVNGGTFEQFL
ncbi:hypothetical protein X777_00117, partial [Ooceraea biroi]